MKKYLFHVLEDVCIENNKDPSAVTKLLEVMSHYGYVDDYDNVVSAVCADHQKTIDNLTAQIKKYESLNLTQDEICLLNAYRLCKTDVEKVHTEKEVALSNQLIASQEVLQNMVTQIQGVIDAQKK